MSSKEDAADGWAPSAGIEPAAYRLGGGRSIRLSYEGEGGALRGALLPVAVFLAVKVTGKAGLARWDRLSWGIGVKKTAENRQGFHAGAMLG